MMELPDALDEIGYQQLVARFDLLWSRAPQASGCEHMDQMMRLMEAFEATRRIASSA